MATLTIHRVHRTAGVWSHDAPESSFERVSVSGLDLALTRRNYYLDAKAGKARWTDDGEYVRDAYLVRDGKAIYAFTLPSGESIESRLAIPLAEDGRPLRDHVADMLVADGRFDRILAAAGGDVLPPPAPAP